MSVALPDTVRRYFELDPQGDLEEMLALFAEEATVTDEGETMRGRDAIRRWRVGTASKYTYTTEVTGAEAGTPGECLVFTRLTGDFPGGTVDLRWDFAIENGRIKNLVITPERA
jgi:ketosteroid isomerase-like protein